MTAHTKDYTLFRGTGQCCLVDSRDHDDELLLHVWQSVLEWGGSRLAWEFLIHLFSLFCLHLGPSLGLLCVFVPRELHAGHWHGVDEGPASPAVCQWRGKVGWWAGQQSLEQYDTVLAHHVVSQVEEVGAPLLHAINDHLQGTRSPAGIHHASACHCPL